MWNRSLRAAVAASCVALAPAALAGPNGNVLSNNIRDADGTSGQNSTTGAGVKTPHLQNGAVTAPKIADGAITAPKFAPSSVGTTAIASGAVTAAKLAAGAVGTLALQDGAVTGAKLAAGTVGAAALQDGAVTTTKLAGPIPAALIDRTGLDADSLDGYQAGDFSPIGHDHVLAELQGSDTLARRSRQVIHVAMDGDDVNVFRTLTLAFGKILDASPTNPYLIKIAPGTYDVGASALMMRQYVDLEGSGASVTRIRGAGTPVWALLNAASNSEIRGITVEATGDQPAVLASNQSLLLRDSVVLNPNGTAVFVTCNFQNPSTALIERVTIIGKGTGLQVDAFTDTLVRSSVIKATGPGTYPSGALFNRGWSTKVRDSWIGSEGTGVFNFGSMSLANTDVVASATAVVAENNYTAAPGPVTVESSRLSGANTLFLGRDAIIQVAGSRLQGSPPPRTWFKTLTCLDSYGPSFVPVTSECDMGP